MVIVCMPQGLLEFSQPPRFVWNDQSQTLDAISYNPNQDYLAELLTHFDSSLEPFESI